MNILESRLSVLKWFVVFLLSGAPATAAQLCSEKESVDITNGIMDSDGRVEHKGVHYNRSQYFQDENVRRGCVCLVRQCVYVCDAEEWANIGLKELNVTVSGGSSDGDHEVNLVNDDRFHLLLRKPNCVRRKYTVYDSNRLIHITTEGKISHFDKVYNYQQFCLHPKLAGLEASLCEPEYITWMNTIQTWGRLVSLGCLVITLMLYAFLPALQNLSGLTLMCFVATLALHYLLVVFEALDIYSKQSVMCWVSGFAIHFTSMASSLWLYIMSFDIYRAFTGSRGRTSDRGTFLYYCLYAWGTPLLYQSLIFLFSYKGVISYDQRMNVGADKCVIIATLQNLFLYYFLPMLLLFIANIVLFVITSKHIFGEVRSDVDNKDRQRFSLCLWLFFIKNAPLIIRILGLLVFYPKWMYYVLNIFNCFVAIIICFLLVWKQCEENLLLQRCFERKSAARDDHVAYTSAQPVDFKSLSNGDQTLSQTSALNIVGHNPGVNPVFRSKPDC